ncbi:hypothetical protein VPFG_00197 [Vibrio phage nt-1]|uniref:Uncharacterized protein n=1 Tax=Vibrio phage nt-1 TaxID=115992 RepID=R9TJC7_9CAUD|nr:hypothetical protein VPFG_00197 [Vibrio phage nt-1]AGN30197.1 hypothetical protein VPFG_00197 [Vibrio phage nt-1]
MTNDELYDTILVDWVTGAMTRKLSDAREKGRRGWNDKNVCSIDYLYELRDKALKDNDHVSVLNYTAMIAIRECNK